MRCPPLSYYDCFIIRQLYDQHFTMYYEKMQKESIIRIPLEIIAAKGRGNLSAGDHIGEEPPNTEERFLTLICYF